MKSSSTSIKQLERVLRNSGSHWVGDGFPVRSLFTYNDDGDALSPFLLLDYAGPRTFPATDKRLGVGEHPHRGFETVTIVYDGEVEHRDSSGGGGRIGPGDVQWMTAASGIVHEEFHGRDFARSGGPFEMVQLWVNLPAKDKMNPPHYQSITRKQIPELILRDNIGRVRVIAGEFDGCKGPAQTHTPIHVWDMRFSSAQEFDIPVPEFHTCLLVVLDGEIHTQGNKLFPAEVAMFERSGNTIGIDSARDAKVLLLTGQPLNEPIIGSGPFVMNTVTEIQQAIMDYQRGKMGHLS